MPEKSSAHRALHEWHEPRGVGASDSGERERRSPFSWDAIPGGSVPTALITGVSGQDGSYLAEFLVRHGYRVIGTTRNARRALESPFALALAGVDLFEESLESGGVVDLVRRERPDEVYHLSGPTSVSASWDDPAGAKQGIVLPTALLLEAIVEMLPSPRVFFAGSCEMFAAEEQAQDESSPIAPESPYARAKLEALELVKAARDKYGVYAVTGILFNHESPRRGAGFVTGKIARAAARIAMGTEQGLTLGNIEARRDWSFAGDVVKAMWLMQFQEEPEDLVIGSGVSHSVSDFCRAAFDRVGLNWKDYVTVDASLIRRADAPLRLANPARAEERLGWTPEVDFERLVAMMVDRWGMSPADDAPTPP